jgi:ferritin-like metal-binding protein YciE
MQQTATSSTGMSGPQPGTFRVEDAREMMVSGLRNAHGLEQQAIEMLERNAERLEHYPELHARIAQHLVKSRQQQAMVAQALQDLGESPSTLKDTVMGLVQNVQMMTHAAASDEVLKNSFAGYAFEHFEIASYRALMVIARAAGEPRVEQVAQQILAQEEEMANWLELHLPEIVSQHLVLMGSGEQKR